MENIMERMGIQNELLFLMTSLLLVILALVLCSYILGALAFSKTGKHSELLAYK